MLKLPFYLAFILLESVSAFAATSWKFDFGAGPTQAGNVQVTPKPYSKETGYGFEDPSAVTVEDRNGPDALRRDFVTSDKPFFFSVDVPEGNYNVTVTFVNQTGETNNTVKAEARRLMLENVHTAPGKFETRTFTVNMRTSMLKSGAKVGLKPGEQVHRDWDDRLTFEFNGKHPCVCGMDI